MIAGVVWASADLCMQVIVYSCFPLSCCRRSESYSRPPSYNRAVFRFFRYYWAAERGAAGEDCSATYHHCPADLEDVVNISVLNFWQRLASLVSIKLSDE